MGLTCKNNNKTHNVDRCTNTKKEEEKEEEEEEEEEERRKNGVPEAHPIYVISEKCSRHSSLIFTTI